MNIILKCQVVSIKVKERQQNDLDNLVAKILKL